MPLSNGYPLARFLKTVLISVMLRVIQTVSFKREYRFSSRNRFMRLVIWGVVEFSSAIP